MFSTSSYLTAWAVYLLGSAGLVAVVWHLTRSLRWAPLRLALRLSTALLLLVPHPADPAQDYLAPALIISLLEGIFEGGEAMARAGLPLLITWLGALIVALVLQALASYLYRRRRQQRQQQQQLDDERQSLLDASEVVAENMRHEAPIGDSRVT